MESKSDLGPFLLGLLVLVLVLGAWGALSGSLDPVKPGVPGAVEVNAGCVAGVASTGSVALNCDE